MEPIIFGIVGLLVGVIVTYFIVKSLVTNQNKTAEEDAAKRADETVQRAKEDAQRILTEAKRKSDDIISNAESKNEAVKKQKIKETREKFHALKKDLASDRQKHELKMKEREVEVKSKESDLQSKLDKFQSRLDTFNAKRAEFEQRETELSAIRENLDKQLKVVSKKREELEHANDKHIRALETVAKLSEVQAKEQLLQAVQAKAETEALALKKDILQQSKNEANRQAKKIVLQTIQRMCAEYTIENTVTVFNLDSDDLKGQIIGREGRNIRTLEQATGAEIVVDDTPEAIVISSFDPIRREVCRLSLKRLVADGRIHPARIEEVVNKTRKELEQEIVEIGERTVISLDLHGLHPYLVKMVGRMRFRSSYGQNLLKHSIETAHLCAIMAAELGLNAKEVKMAKRAGLLHDIGKVSEEESDLSHALLGMEICKKHKENAHVCNAVGAHHDEIDMNHIISPIVQACDAISGARPGARREILESYLKRIEELEELAMSHDGVQKAFAMQAGRELRVIVESERVSDQAADDLAFMISQKIQDDMQYPGQIRVTVIREKRATAIAR